MAEVVEIKMLITCGECGDPVEDGIGSHPKCRDRACTAQMKKEGKIKC
jgi:hypothetical protein